MHIHLPKPLHGWRELFGEIGVIVIGVLIALGAEQLIEQVHWQHKRERVVETLRTELGEDNAVISSGYLATTRCTDEALDRLQAAVDSRADRQEIAKIARSIPEFRGVWDDQALQAATASEALLHAGPDETTLWSGPYSYVPLLNASAQDQWEYTAMLNAWNSRPGPLTPLEEERAQVAISNLRLSNSKIRGLSAAFLSSIRDGLGIRPHPQDQVTLYEDARARYGDCALDLRTIDPASLRSAVVSRLNRNAR